MSAPNGKRLLLVATAVIVLSLVVTACAIQLRGDGESAPMGSSASRAADPLAAQLKHCRTLTSEQSADIQECRRVWAENRRRFLGQRKTPAAPFVDAQANTSAPSSTQPKDSGHVLREGSVATGKSE